MRILLVIFLTLSTYFRIMGQSRPQEKDSILVHLSFSGEKGKSNKFLPITLRIESKQKRILQVPKEALWGYEQEGPCFFSLEMQRKINGRYMDLKWDTRVDGPLSMDIDTLNDGEFREYTTTIDKFYEYNGGEYRVRVLCLFSSINDIKDIYSNWAYFYGNREMKRN